MQEEAIQQQSTGESEQSEGDLQDIKFENKAQDQVVLPAALQIPNIQPCHSAGALNPEQAQKIIEEAPIHPSTLFKKLVENASNEPVKLQGFQKFTKQVQMMKEFII